MAPYVCLIPCQCHWVNTPAQNGTVTTTHAPKWQQPPHPHLLVLTSTSCHQAVLQTPHHPSRAILPSPSPLLCAISSTLVCTPPCPLDTHRHSPSPLCAVSAVSPTPACVLPLTLMSALVLLKEHLHPYATCPLLPILPSHPPWYACPHVPLIQLLTHTTIRWVLCCLALALALALALSPSSFHLACKLCRCTLTHSSCHCMSALLPCPCLLPHSCSISLTQACTQLLACSLPFVLTSRHPIPYFHMHMTVCMFVSILTL